MAPRLLRNPYQRRAHLAPASAGLVVSRGLRDRAALREHDRGPGLANFRGLWVRSGFGDGSDAVFDRR